MTQANEQDAWDELFIISIMPKGGSAIQFAGDIITYDIQPGEKSFDSAANGLGGRVKLHKPEGDTEVTMEGYWTQVGNGKGPGGLINTDDTVQPLSISRDHVRQLFAVSIMSTTNRSQTDAFAVTTEDDRAERDTFYNAEFTVAPKVFTDGSRKTTLKFKVTPFTKANVSNITEESTDGSTSATLPEITFP